MKWIGVRMARSERRILGFTIAILILALAVSLLGWANRDGQSERRKLQEDATSNRARIGQLEGQLRDHGIEPAPATTSTTAPARRSQPRRVTTTTTTTFFPPPTTTTTARPSPSTTSTTGPPPSTTTTTACAVQLIGRCVP